MTVQFHPAVKHIAYLLIIGFLLFLLINGCHKYKYRSKLVNEIQLKIDTLEHRMNIQKNDIESNKKEYEISLALMNGQVEIKDNQLTKTETELDAANKRINILLANHHDISPSTDTSITVVPNDFVIDCNGCFTELQNGQKLVQKYKTDVDQLNFEWHKKSILQTNRINQQEQEKSKLAKSLQDCMDISKSAISAGKPKGQLYFSGNVIWSPFPIGASVGLSYQNKRKMQYGLRWGYGTYWQAVETEINLPLSFKRR